MIKSQLSLIALCLSLVALVYPQNTYSNFTTFDNPNAFTSVAWSQDQSHVLIFGQANSTASAFRVYDWMPITDDLYLYFEFPPKNIEFFTDDQQRNNLIYSNSQGKVRRRIYTFAGYTELMLYAVPEGSKHTNIEKATASSDGTLYAMFCAEDSLVYIGDLRKQVSLKTVLDYSKKGVVRSIRWRPGTTELIVSGGSGQNRYFLKYNAATEQTEDWSTLTNAPVSDVAFSSDGNTAYFIESSAQEHNNVTQVVWQYSLISKEKKQFISKSIPVSLTNIQIRGTFLSARNKQQEYIWRLSDGFFLGSYEHTMTTSGLSIDGTNLILLNQDSTQGSLRKLCGDSGYVYQPSTASCLRCEFPCTTCFLDINRCTTCATTYFRRDDFTCGQCMTGCFRCLQAQTCFNCDTKHHWAKNQQQICVCEKGYIYDGDNECIKCQQLIQNCLTCQDKDHCSTCKDSFVVNDKGVCQQCNSFMEGCVQCQSQEHCLTCEETFALTNNVCEHCSALIKGCNKCQSSDVCTECLPGSTLTADNKCEQEKQPGSVIFVIIILVAATAILISIGFLARKWMHKKKTAHVKSLLERESMGEQQKIEDN